MTTLLEANDAFLVLELRLNRIATACTSTAPKQAIGEMLDAMLKMPEWSTLRTAIAEAEKAEPIPAGYQLVPIEPTPEMLGEAVPDEGAKIIDGKAYAHDLYKAMLAAAPVQAQERKPKWNVLAITTAYEQGFGKGIQAKRRGAEISNPHAEGDCREAWAYGYEEGSDKPTPLEAQLVDTLLGQAQEHKLLTDEQIDAAWRSVDYTQPYADFRMAVGRAIEAKVREQP